MSGTARMVPALMARHCRRRRHRAQVGHLPSRSETRKHPAAGKRHRTEGRGLRRREADQRRARGEGGTHVDRGHDRRHAGLHGAGAAARRGGRCARRCVQPRRDGVRNVDRRGCPTAAASLFDIGMKQVEGKVDTSGIDAGELAGADPPRDCLRQRTAAGPQLADRHLPTELQSRNRMNPNFATYCYFFLACPSRPGGDRSPRPPDRFDLCESACVVVSNWRCNSALARRSDSTCPHVLGVHLRAAILRNLASFLEFVHALLQARFSVD